MYIGAQDQTSYLEPQITVFLNGSQGTFEVRPRATLAPGSYTGTLRLLACPGVNCSRHLGNSPVSLPYTIRVRPGLRVTPIPHAPVAYTSGEDGVANFTIQLPENVTTSEVSTINGGSICHIANATPTSFSLVANSVPSGNYLCQFRVEAGTRSTLGGVNFHASPPPGGNRSLSVAESSLTFTSAEGAASGSQRLHVTPPSWDNRYDITVSGYGDSIGNWLRFSRVSDGFEVVADASALPQGSYRASVRVFSLSPNYAPEVLIPVAVTVGPGLVRPPDVMRIIDSESSVADMSGSVAINLVDGVPLQWSAASGAAWLTLAGSTGPTGTPLSFSFDTAAFRALPNGREHVANITVTTSNPAIGVMIVAVRVNKRLAQVTGLGPYLHISGRPLRAQVRGLGFSAMSSLARVSVAGLANANFTLVNDTTLEMDVPDAVAAGAYPISISNTLGITVGSRTLKVIDPVSYPYAAMVTGQSIGNVVYDAERQRIYVTSNGSQTRFQRFERDGAGWVATEHPGATSNDLGLSNDGSMIVITEPPSRVRMLDAQTLAPAGEFEFAGDFRANSSNGRQVAITSDGRAWLGVSLYQNNRNVVVFDSNEGTFSSHTLPGSPSRIDGVSLEQPRNGTRLIVIENEHTDFLSGVLDAATSQYTQHSSPFITASYNLHSSDDGSRMSSQGRRIYDGNMQRYASPQDALRTIMWVIQLGLISPDGRRAYVVLYDPDDYHIFGTPPPPQSRPRIYVVDTSSSTPTPNMATVLGYFEIDDYPMCRSSINCDLRTKGAIAPDGRTLFLAGQDRLVVVPVPAESSLIAHAQPAPLMQLWIPDAPVAR